MIVNGRPKQWSEKTFYNYQKKARQEFTALFWQKEQEYGQDFSKNNADSSNLPRLSQSDEAQLQTGKLVREKDQTVHNRASNTITLILVGFSILAALLVFITLFAIRLPLLPKLSLSPLINTATVVPTHPATVVPSDQKTVCGDREADPISIDGSVPRFLRSQAVSSFTIENTPGILNNKVRSLFIDRSGLWVGYFATETNPQNGLGHYDRTSRSLANCNHIPSITGQNINAIATDQTGKLWIATEKNGLASYDGKEWQHYSTENGLPSNEIYGLTLDQQNNLWVGTWEGVAKFDGRTWSVPYTVHNATLFNNHVHTILFDHAGNIWVGHIEKGISKYNQADGTWINITSTPSGLGGNRIRSMALRKEPSTNQESIWVATQDGGVSKFENGVWWNYRVEDGLPSNDVRTVAVDKYNRVWAATAQGVVYWDNQAWVTYNTLDTFSLAFGISCPDQTCSIDDDHVWTGTAKFGLTQSRLPLLKSETPLDVNAVCFETSNRESICPPIVQDKASGDLTITYPKTMVPGEQFYIAITVTPRANYTLKEDRGDMLSNTDKEDSNLFGLWEHFKVTGTVDAGQPFKFVDYDNPLKAPQLPDNVQEQIFTSTWRVWRYTRYIGPYIHLTFTVKK
jgi:hypothetical protein